MLDSTAREHLVRLIREAGTAVMAHYHDDVEVTTKADRSPLTAADCASHDCLLAGLREHFPHWPVLSEEGADIPFAERRAWRVFWLVDPLDGTKEFIRRNGEFTINIALIVEGRPVWGWVYLPVPRVLYAGGPDAGAWRQRENEPPVPIRCRQRSPGEPLPVVGSRSHASPELESFLAGLPVRELISVGSSLKFCRVAEGVADLYPRFGPTMEWDTAAGHAVVLGAGGVVVDGAGNPMRYNRPVLRNGRFLAAARPWGEAWLRAG